MDITEYGDERYKQIQRQSLWIARLLGLPVDYTSYSSLDNRPLKEQLHKFNEEEIGKHEIPRTSYLAEYLFLKPGDYQPKQYQLFHRRELAYPLTPFAWLESKEFQSNGEWENLFTLQEKVEDTAPPPLLNIDAVKKITHFIAPDYSELPSDTVPFTIILPLELPTETVDGQSLRWEHLILSSDQKNDPLWPIRIIFALQTAGLSWLAPDKNTTAGRIIQALDLDRYFQGWTDDYGVSSLGVNTDEKLKLVIKETLQKMHLSLSNTSNFYPKCYLSPHSPLRTINILKNQKGKVQNTSNDLRSIRETLARMLNKWKGFIITLDIPLKHYPGTPHDIPLIACPQEIFDFFQVNRPISDDKLSDPMSMTRRANFKAALAPNACGIDGKTSSLPDPDQTDELSYYRQRATKLRKYLYKTYNKSKENRPDILRSDIPQLAAVMCNIFVKDSTRSVQGDDGKENTIYDISIMEGRNHLNGFAKKHYWIEIKGCIIDISMKIYDENAPATLATASSRWHEQFESINTYSDFGSLNLTKEELATIQKVTARAEKFITREVNKDNAAAYKRGKL